MYKNDSEIQFTLEDFQGPLPLLMQLIQKKELSINGISLHHLITQYYSQWNSSSQDAMDQGAEFLSDASSLLLAKSQSLLPRHSESEEIETLYRKVRSK